MGCVRVSLRRSMMGDLAEDDWMVSCRHVVVVVVAADDDDTLCELDDIDIVGRSNSDRQSCGAIAWRR